MRWLTLLTLMVTAAVPAAKAGPLTTTASAPNQDTVTVGGKTLPIYGASGFDAGANIPDFHDPEDNGRGLPGQTRYMAITVAVDGEGLHTLLPIFGKGRQTVDILLGGQDFTLAQASMTQAGMSKGHYNVVFHPSGFTVGSPAGTGAKSSSTSSPAAPSSASAPVTGFAPSAAADQVAVATEVCRDDPEVSAASGTHINNCSDETTPGYDLQIDDNGDTATVAGRYSLRAYDTRTDAQTLKGIYGDLAQKLSASGFQLVLQTDPIHITARKGDIWIIEDIYDTTPVGYEQKVFHASRVTFNHP